MRELGSAGKTIASSADQLVRAIRTAGMLDSLIIESAGSRDPAYVLQGQNGISVGGGFQSGQSAFALGLQHQFGGSHVVVSVSGSFSAGENNVGVGAGFAW